MGSVGRVKVGPEEQARLWLFNFELFDIFEVAKHKLAASLICKVDATQHVLNGDCC